MKMYSRLFALDLSYHLEAAGVLTGDAKGAAITHPAQLGLFISQIGGVVESSAFDLDCGYGTGYMLALHVAVDLPVFTILRAELDLPWEDPQFQWLTDPSEQMSRDNMYQVPGCARLKFPRDEVINHRRQLRRGHSLDGLLLGWSFESIPDSYRHGANIDATLVIIDEMAHRFSSPVQLWANRIAKIDRQRRKKNTRRPLLERRDGAKDELVQQ